MLHPETYLRFIDERIGYGVFARRTIPRGTVVWVRDALDQVLTTAQLSALPAVLQQQVRRLGYVDAAGDHVLCWDHGRYMNHSCAPNTTSIGTLLEIARRDVQPDEELRCEYGLAHVSEPFECSCGAEDCRGTLVPDDRAALWRRWDREAAEAFAWALAVPQPALAAARTSGPGAWIVQAILDRRSLTLPSWSAGVPGGA